MMAACATVKSHNFGSQNVRGLGLAEVQVEFAPKLRLSWPAEEKAAKQAAGGDAPKEAIQARVTETIKDRVKTALMTEAGRDLAGPRKIRAVVTVKSFHIPGMATRILISSAASFDAEITLVDMNTNAPIITYPGKIAAVGLSGGLVAPLEAALGDQTDPGWMLIYDYTSNYRKWLLQT